MIPHSRPSLGTEEEEAVVRIVRSGMLAQGNEVAQLENQLAQRMHCKHAIAVSSGSAALHLALRVLDLPQKAKVQLPSFVCTALLNAIRLTDAIPSVADITPRTFQLAPHPVDKDTKAILAPHMFGHTVDLEAFHDLDIPVIEDCALALGAHYQDRAVGSLGHMGVCSFYATKVICGGEGGAIVTSDDTLAARLRDLRDYDGRQDDTLRYNYKLTDLQAAIILCQLNKLDTFLERRRHLGEKFTQALTQTQATLPIFKPGEFPFRYVITHPQKANDTIAAFESRGISVRKPIFYPIHKVLHLNDQDFPITTRAYAHAVSLPLYPDLENHEVDHILDVAQEIL